MQNLNNSPIDYKKDNPNSLIQISKEVYSFLSQKLNAKCNNVTDHILNKIVKENLVHLRFKNMQRRVYDAINVMHAVGVIEKNKSNLRFITKTNQMKKDNENNNSDLAKYENIIKSLKEKLNIKFSDINKKQHELAALSSKVFIILIKTN